MPQLPSALRAAIGLAAETAEQARHLPATLPAKAVELPMLAVSTALQLSLRAQQRYAMLAARGDEILNHREPTDEPPPWATFDDPVTGDVLRDEDEPDHAEQEDALGDDTDRGAPAFDSPGPGKSVPAPRNGAPSRFDAVGDEPVDEPYGDSADDAPYGD